MKKQQWGQACGWVKSGMLEMGIDLKGAGEISKE